MWTKLSLYFHTLRHLKWRQIWYRLWYALRKRLFHTRLLEVSAPPAAKLQFQPSLGTPIPFFQAALTFTFLNQTHTFDPKIDWNFNGFGKLWTYNLTYFEYLNQENISREQGLALMHDFIEQMPGIRDGLEPFPTSLRIIFWTRFLIKHDIQDQEIEHSLYQQLLHLNKNLEYHLLGNHLLENAFALLFGAVHFNDDKMLRKAKKLLQAQLSEQILPDGAHFERSPMYHQLMLYRLLDCINLLQNNSTPATEILPFLQERASKMLGWLEQMTFQNGDTPLVNDSAQQIAPTSQALFSYAERLGLKKEKTGLGASGYRRFANENYELVVDAGDIGPDYIPGHAHCDTLSFVLHIGGKPFIVDTGTSTYEANARRQLERSTAAHNTVQINEAEQSEVWGAFRVARRAKASILHETKASITATHDGFRRIGGQHTRTFRVENETIVIEDKVVIEKKKLPARAYLHFHPDIEIEVQDQRVLTELAVLTFENALKIETASYFYAPEFNKTVPATMLTIWFEENLKTQVRFSPLAIREMQTTKSEERTAKSELQTKMKILFLTDNFPPEVNAPATRTFEHCAAWVRAGAEVTVITCVPNFPEGKVFAGYKNRWYQEEEMAGIRVIRVWSYITANAGFAKRIADYLSFALTATRASLQVQADVIVATSPQFFTAVAGSWASFWKRKPWIMEVRDLWPESIRAVNAMGDSKMLDWLEKWELSLYRQAKKVVVVTDSFRENISGRGIPAEKITVVKNGVHLHEYQPIPKDKALLRALNLEGKFVVGYIGTHGMAHKLDFILDCAREADERVHFLFVGGGAEKERLLQLKDQWNLTNVTMLPPVSKSEVKRYISVSDVALVPLKKSDTFKTVIPSKIFENAAMGKPILLGVEGESKAIIESYGAGLCFEPENKDDFLAKLTAISQNEKLYQSCQEGCAKLAKDFDREKLAGDMLQVIREVGDG